MGFRLVGQPRLSCNCLTTLPLRRLLCRAPYKQPWLLWCPVPGIMLRMCRHLTARLGRRCQHHPHGTDKAPTPSPSGASSSHSGETEGTCPHAELSGCSWLTGPAPPLPRPSTAPPRGSAHSSSPGAATLPLAASLPRAEAAETQRETHLHGIPGTIQRTFQNVPALGDSHSELPFQESHFLFLLKTHTSLVQHPLLLFGLTPVVSLLLSTLCSPFLFVIYPCRNSMHICILMEI